MPCFCWTDLHNHLNSKFWSKLNTFLWRQWQWWWQQMMKLIIVCWRWRPSMVSTKIFVLWRPWWQWWWRQGGWCIFLRASSKSPFGVYIIQDLLQNDLVDVHFWGSLRSRSLWIFREIYSSWNKYSILEYIYSKIKDVFQEK